MKALFWCCTCVLLVLSGTVTGRETESARNHPMELYPDFGNTGMIFPKSPMYAAAAVDTYNIVWFDFEKEDWQGWTRFDNSAQVAAWFHADDFNGLSGGSAGRLIAIEGSQSAWCGARPTDAPYDYMCSWIKAPGYGNNWNQSLMTGEINFTGALHLSYHGVFDSEPGWDFIYVQYDAGGDNWISFQTWDGIVDTIIAHELRITKNRTKLRFNFVSDPGWSDEDGKWPTDGACIIDSITITDESTPDPLIDFEDFEDWDLYATDNFDGGDIWHGHQGEAYGLYSGLYQGLQDKDPCGDNIRSQVVFFEGSSYPSSSYPGLFDTPFCKGAGNISDPCQDEMIVSPVIDMTKFSTCNDEIQDADIPAEDRPFLGGTVFRMTHYRDLPLTNLVFYVWHVREIDPITSCPGQWLDHGAVYYGPDKDYILGTGLDISELISGDNPVQIAVGVVDNCADWYGVYGDCSAHTPSPWFDNIRLQRYKTTGPQWKYKHWDMFQDNFPETEYNLDSWIRADMAIDVNPIESPINPGDSMVISCTAKMAGSLRNGGLTGEAEVYLHVRATDIGPFGKPPLSGLQLEGTYGTYVDDDGEWTIIQCDSARVAFSNVIQDMFMVDLNDSLFTRGYMIEYYFKAWDIDNYSSTCPRNASEGQYFEFTCLPTGKSNVLFVDDFHGRGTFEGDVETYWNPTFRAVIPPENQPDRYDVNNPSSLLGNGLGGRARLSQVLYNEGAQSGYSIIIWDCGNLNSGTISDGTEQSDKGDDCSLLIDWLDQSENDVGLLVCGDEIANDLVSLTSIQSMALLSSWCGVNLVESSYFDLTGGREAGGIVNPLCTGDVASIFGSSLEFYATAGCPIINQFDVIDATANGSVAVRYPDYDGESYAAAIQSLSTNASGNDARTMWFGFSWMYIRDVDGSNSPLVRNWIFEQIYLWFNGIPKDDISEDDEVPMAYRLGQNFPNPFNPTTTIKFDVRAKGHISLMIYNVAGQLVKTVVDEVMDAGSYAKEWNGTNNAGADVASGIYFYRMETRGFSATRKMVLLR